MVVGEACPKGLDPPKAIAIALFGLNPTGKYKLPFTHDSGFPWGRERTANSPLPPVTVGKFNDVAVTFLNTAYPQALTLT